MSGGSLNYLCTADVTKRHSDYEQVRAYLVEHGCAGTLAFVKVERALKLFTELEKAHAELYDVLHAVEWAISGDIGSEEAFDEITQFKEQP